MNFAYFLFISIMFLGSIERLSEKLDQQQRELIKAVQLETLKSCNANSSKVPEK